MRSWTRCQSIPRLSLTLTSTTSITKQTMTNATLLQTRVTPNDCGIRRGSGCPLRAPCPNSGPRRWPSRCLCLMRRGHSSRRPAYIKALEASPFSPAPILATKLPTPFDTSTNSSCRRDSSLLPDHLHTSAALFYRRRASPPPPLCFPLVTASFHRPRVPFRRCNGTHATTPILGSSRTKGHCGP
jgi:hypothetical protein